MFMIVHTHDSKILPQLRMHKFIVNIEVFFSGFSWSEMILMFWEVNFAGQKCRVALRVYYQECL